MSKIFKCIADDEGNVTFPTVGDRILCKAQFRMAALAGVQFKGVLDNPPVEGVVEELFGTGPEPKPGSSPARPTSLVVRIRTDDGKLVERQYEIALETMKLIHVVTVDPDPPAGQ